MMLEKGIGLFLAIFVVVSSKVCLACFDEAKHSTVPLKTGSPFYMNCVCEKEGYSVAHLTWIDPNGQPIVPNGPDTHTYTNIYTEISLEKRLARLTINSISSAVSGDYTCTTNYKGNTYNRTYTIEAYDSMYLVNTSMEQIVIIGEDSEVRCEVRSNNIAYTKEWHRFDGPDLKWLTNDTKYSVLEHGLLIKNVTNDDAGTYQCSIIDIENTMIEYNINVTVAARPVISALKWNKPQETITSGNYVTIECVADGLPHPDYFWSKIADSLGNPINNASESWRQLVNTIVFDNIQKDNAGTYECIAENIVGSVSSVISIEVKVPPKITSLDNVTAVEGSEAQIACKATGVPNPGILISHSVKGLDTDNRIAVEVKNTTDKSELYLTIMNVTRMFESSYTCTAGNDAGNVTQDMYLTVFYKPYFVEQEETVWGWQGKVVTMSCAHESNPSSTIIWKFQGNEIEHETTTAEHVQVNKLLQEEIGDVSGYYLVLTVDNMTMYGEYECTASNDYGQSTKRIHLKEAFKPAAVRNVTIINMSATTITFLIQGPDATDNAQVHGYTAEYDLIQSYDITSVHLYRTCGLDRNFTIDRLKPNSTYSIKFAAQNEVGVGVWSEATVFTTPETSAPEPPVFDGQNKLGKLRWKTSEANGDPIDHYSVEFCPFYGQVINTTLCQKEQVSVTEFALDKLDRNTKYSFKIRAHNSHGYSDYMDEEVTTPEKLVGGALLSAGAVISISVVVVFLCLLVLDLLLLCWRRQGIIASLFFRKNKKKTDNLHTRDKKGLLVREGERAEDSLTNPNNGHRELVYNKTTGVITGKHSTV